VAGDLACTGNGGVSAASDTVKGHATGQCAPSDGTADHLWQFLVAGAFGS
jgi:hypothetical protein